MKKILSLLLVFILLFSAVPISATQEIDPLQKFFVYALSLEESSRIAVVDILKGISRESDVTDAKTDAVSAYFSDMSREEIGKILIIYSGRSTKNQSSICDIVLFGAKPIPNAANMPTAVSLLNELIIGDSSDIRGSNYFYSLLAIYSMYTLFGGTPYIAKNHNLPGLIDLYLPDDMPEDAVVAIGGALKFMPQLGDDIENADGASLTEKLFSHAEILVNSCPSEEIYYFKKALAELGVFYGNIASPQNTKFPEIAFRDLDNYDWAVHQIRALAAAGVVNGVSEYSFAPGDMVTREQFVKMLVEAFDLTGSADIKFTDANENEWYYPYLQTAFANKIVNGVSETEFGVGQPISREQMATMVYRVINHLELPMNSALKIFDDDAEISDWAKAAVGSMGANGIINGVGNNMFAPLENAERAAAAVLIYNVMKFANLL
ncbi:MAG: S-layer homology domain-containing protein [Clostridia bacterium]|nr:S-layer homology domain-containing protein [Clostridia bacterium]MBR2973230.1 S-layer homology domain-containing protein [Clostridia bacterium]